MPHDNRLKVPYSVYYEEELLAAIRDIPEERRRDLADEIQVKANFMGCTNPRALKTIVRLLRREPTE